MKRVSVTEVRTDLARMLRVVSRKGQRVALTCRGRVVGILVSPEDAEAIEALEDCEDVADGRRVLRAGRFVPYAKARKRLGLA